MTLIVGTPTGTRSALLLKSLLAGASLQLKKIQNACHDTLRGLGTSIIYYIYIYCTYIYIIHNISYIYIYVYIYTYTLYLLYILTVSSVPLSEALFHAVSCHTVRLCCTAGRLKPRIPLLTSPWSQFPNCFENDMLIVVRIWSRVQNALSHTGWRFWVATAHRLDGSCFWD